MAMEALNAHNAVAREAEAAVVADRTAMTEATEAEITYTTTNISGPYGKSGAMPKKKAKAKLSAKEKKERSVSSIAEYITAILTVDVCRLRSRESFHACRLNSVAVIQCVPSALKYIIHLIGNPVLTRISAGIWRLLSKESWMRQLKLSNVRNLSNISAHARRLTLPTIIINSNRPD